nr:ABC transporter permease [uncultured Blautia sp.]
MLNMIRMELFRMFKTKSLYVIWMVMIACVFLTNGLSAEEIKTYSMEEKQEMYEAAMDGEESGNLGMDVTLPTKPGADVSVFDGFYANVKGKFIALFMVIFTVLYATADITSGYVKNIAGQVRNRGNLIFAKAVALLLYVVLTMLLFIGVQMLSNAISYQKLVMGPGKEFFQYAAMQTFLHFALVMVIMCVAVVLRNNVISMMISVCVCMNVLIMLYGVVDQAVEKLGIHDFHMMDYTVSGKIVNLGMNAAPKTMGMAVMVGVVFIVVMLAISMTVFQKRDI